MNWCHALLLWLTLMMPQAVQAAAPLAVFDEGHGQPFRIAGEGPLDLSALAGTFRAAGYEVRTAQGTLTTAGLGGADVLVISGAFQPLAADEVAVVRGFVARGGRLAVMLHVAPPLATLLHGLEVDFTNGTLREHSNLIGGNPQDFRVRDLVAHPLTAGLADFAVYGAWALRGTATGIEILARTGSHAWVDLNHDRRLDRGDAVQPFGVLVAGILGHGRFAVFGDDALFQNRFLEGNNRRLAENLALWLKPQKLGE